MHQHIVHITLVVNDCDEAIQFYTEKLQFNLVKDTQLEKGKRWVLVAPKGWHECCILLAKAVNEEQRSRVGNQTGGRVFLFLHTSNFWCDHNEMINRGVNFVRPPVEENYGTVAVFEDLYGNLWDLIGKKV